MTPSRVPQPAAHAAPHMPTTTIAPVRKTIMVRASVEHAFDVFTEGMDRWWPRSHHIGKSPMTRNIVEPKVGGRCYSQQEEGGDCDWGTVLVWDPPHRLVMAWQITTSWEFEPDVARSSEVEVRFTPEPGGLTRVDLEHRNLERHGPGAEGMRAGVDSPEGWGNMMKLFAAVAEQ